MAQIDQQKIQELQFLEQHMHSILVQKQNMQIEHNEVINALSEIKQSKSEPYKILGNIMVKTTSEKLIKELEEKKKLLEIRLSSVEKQESSLEEKSASLREEIQSQMLKSEKN